MTRPITTQPHFPHQKYLNYPYKISDCLMMYDNAESVLYRDDATGAASKKYTFSCWLKLGELPNYQVLYSSSTNGSNFSAIYRTANHQIGVLEYFSSAYQITVTTTEILRDLHNWYHVVVVMDTTQATEADRLKIWINNHQCTVSGTFPTQNGNYLLPDYYNRGVGRWRHLSANWYDGLMTEMIMLADQALTPSSFGTEINGVWVPISPNVNFSNATDIYFKFDDTSNVPTSLGYDSSGNNNHFTPYQFPTWRSSTVNHMTDSPTNNYCQFDILKNAYITHAWCGLWTQTNTSNAHTGFGTFGMASGRWYWEASITGGTTTIAMIGIAGERNSRYNVYSWQEVDGYMYYSGNGNIYNNNDGGSAYGATFTTGDIIGIAFDADNGILEFFKNDVSQGTYDITATGAGLDGRIYFPAVSDGSGSYYSSIEWNFGQRHGGFWKTCPAGFKALCAKNLPEPRIRKPEKAIDVLLWTGDGNNTKQITGLQFQPNISWIKKRSEAGAHVFCDSVRGSTHMWEPDTSNEEDKYQDYGYINSFNANGITVNKGTQANSRTNDSGETHVAWCFKVLSQYGMDIVTYTGTGAKQAIAHNLGVVPNMIIVKNRSVAANNNVYQDQMASYIDPWTDITYLDLPNATVDSSAPWADTAPTSTHFTVGTQTGTNGNGNNMIAYLFANIPYFSHVFRYYGNAHVNGPVVRIGFKPRFVLFKNANNSNNWWLFDSERDLINPVEHRLYPSDPAAEATGATYTIDFLSNGFKIRSTTDALNKSTNWIFGIAFAERPFKYSNAVI